MKKLLAALLAFIVLFGCFAGCADNTKQNQATEQEVLLYDFEDYDRNFQLMRVMTYFGAVNVNNDTKFVKSGKNSAFLQPLGWHSTMINNSYTSIKAESCLYIPFSSANYDFDYTDATKIREVKLSMFNAEEKDVSLYVGLIFEKNAVEVSELTEFVLKPGWNDIFYELAHDVLSLNHVLTACYGLAVTFDRVESRELKDAPKLYLDDIYLSFYSQSVEIKNLISLEPDEICDFEKMYQIYMVNSDMYDKALKPELDVVTASDYGLVAPSGTKILRVVMKPKELIDGTIYDKIYLSQSLMSAVGFEDLSSDARICFDLYNDTNETLDISVTVQNTKNSGYAGAKHLFANPKRWTKFSVSLEDIDANFDADNPYSKNPGPIRLEWAEFTGEERVIYVDNFHIER